MLSYPNSVVVNPISKVSGSGSGRHLLKVSVHEVPSQTCTRHTSAEFREDCSYKLPDILNATVHFSPLVSYNTFAMSCIN